MENEQQQRSRKAIPMAAMRAILAVKSRARGSSAARQVQDRAKAIKDSVAPHTLSKEVIPSSSPAQGESSAYADINDKGDVDTPLGRDKALQHKEASSVDW